MNKKLGIIMLLLSCQLFSMNENFHIVSKGESLERIAKKYKTDVKTLTKLNNIGNRGDKRTSSRRTAQRSIHRPT